MHEIVILLDVDRGKKIVSPLRRFSQKMPVKRRGTASFNVDSHPACNRQTPSYYVPCVSVHVSRKVGKTFASNKKIYFLLSCKTHSFSFFLQQLEPIMPPRLAPDFSPTKVRTSCTSFGCVCERCKKNFSRFFFSNWMTGALQKIIPCFRKIATAAGDTRWRVPQFGTRNKFKLK